VDPADDRQTADAYLARAAELESHADYVDQHGGGRMSPRWRDATFLREHAQRLRWRARNLIPPPRKSLVRLKKRS
jgi:hypothetical protein